MDQVGLTVGMLPLFAIAMMLALAPAALGHTHAAPRSALGFAAASIGAWMLEGMQTEAGIEASQAEAQAVFVEAVLSASAKARQP